MTYGSLKKLAKILPFFLIEGWVKRFNMDRGTLTPQGYGAKGIPVKFEQVYDGVFLCYSEELELKQRLQDLEREKDRIKERLSGIEPVESNEEES
ncbi:MAG: hypothetical protein WC998_08710 [Candidatus Paceibacterota bacterium]|jgi:hypothetical protein